MQHFISLVLKAASGVRGRKSLLASLLSAPINVSETTVGNHRANLEFTFLNDRLLKCYIKSHMSLAQLEK